MFNKKIIFFPASHNDPFLITPDRERKERRGRKWEKGILEGFAKMLSSSRFFCGVETGGAGAAQAWLSRGDRTGTGSVR